ncbi:MAG TPA: hypothetical protein VEB19_18800, partial [Gemmatimonadaceae bacterium]|nr:hypothetical protein [Gemmatimonadaceae bacterium]
MQTETFVRALRRVGATGAAVGSVLLLATCDLEKLAGPKRLNQAAIDSLFAIAGDTIVSLGASLALGMTSSRDISNTATRWSVSPASIAEVDSVSGVVTGMALGNAIITARIIAPEFDTAYTASHSIRVRYKGIAVQPLDSIPGLGLSRSTVVRGTNDAGEAQAEMLPATLTSRDTTIFRVTGTSVVARKAGDAYIVAEYDGLLDSTTVKVRPQPKALAFATAEYVIKTLNVDRLLSAIVRDQGDSIIASPNVTWSVADPTVAAIDAANGTIRALKADTTRLFATVDTITRSLKLVVRQHVAALVPVDGDGQSAPVASPLATGPRVIARDSSGTPVAGASVIFTPSGDGAVGTVVVVTDANGIAAVDAWQLGSAAGTQSLTASVGTASFSFTATATPAPAARLVFSTQPLSVPAGGTVPAVAVAVTDTLGNIVPSAAGTVAITLAANPGSSVLSGTLTATLTDGIATFGDLTLDALGEGYMLAASAAGLEGTVSQTFNVFGAPAKLTFITQPVGGVIRRALAPAIRVQVQDANGIEVRSATGNIALTLIGGPSSILDGASIVAAEAGTATFSNLSVATAGSGYQLRATMAGGLVATSTAFAIEAVGPGVRLGFVAPPANAVAGTALNVGTGVQVGIFDANGNLVTSAPPTSVSLAFGTNAGGAQISGTATLNTVSGIATFSNITINRTGTGYTLVASASALTTATSDAFNVLAGAAARLRFVQQPTNVEVDAPPTAPVQVAITDANENILTSQVAATLINVTLLGCSGLTGGAAVVQGGVATFSALRIASAGNGCALSASSQGLAAVSSQLFSVVPTGGATRMNFAGVLPAAASAGQTLDTVRVTLQNVGGSVVSGAQASVTLSLADGGASALGGTVTQQTMNGVAKFGDLVINLAGAERRIVATATGFAPLTSSPIVVDAAAPTQLAFVSAPSGAAAGSALPAFQVAVRDALGNIVASSSHAVQLALLSNPSGAMLGGVTTVAAVDGVATFAAVHVSASGTGYSLTATAPGTTVASATSAEFSIGAGAPAGLRFATPPATVVANVPFTDDVQVQVVDAQGNPVTAGAMVSVALVGGAGGTTLLGTRTVAAVNGLATFDDLRVSHAGTGLRLSATAPGLAARTSDVFDATLGAPTRLSIRSQPSLMVAAPSVGTVQIAITDAANNTVPTASADITLAIATGTGTLGGTVTRPTLNGVATFDDITLTPAGTFTLRATSVPVFSEVVGGSVVVTPQDLSISEGAGQSGIAGSNVATNPAVLVLDGAGAPVAGVSVTFNATGTGTLNNSAATSVQVMSDASGLASVVWRLRNAAGVDTLIAFLTAGPA